MPEKTINWGIIGPGRIARKFAAALKLVPGANLHAVASRDMDRAKGFAGEFGAKAWYDDYEALARDPRIDAVYIATPHSDHHQPAIACLRQRKAVLCEKPMSVNVAGTASMIAAAKAHGAFLMEAMWTRFIPTIQKTKELIDAGGIGELKYIQADFGFRAPVNPEGRLYNLSLGGGALLDVGVYPIFFILFLLGKPLQIKAISHLAQTGADETTAGTFLYRDGTMASFSASIVAPTPITAAITGTLGTITLERPWYKGSVVTVMKSDKITDRFSLPYGDNGFEFQIAEVHRCLNAGLTESVLMPTGLSLLMAEIMEAIGAQSGLRYELKDHGYGKA